MSLQDLNKFKTKVRSFKAGSILVFTLWVVVILFLFGLGLAYRGRLEVKTMSYGIDELKIHYIIKGITNWALEKFKVLDEEVDLGNLQLQPLKNGKLKVEDEESKININKIPIQVLAQVVGLDLAKRIVANRPFYNIESLLLVKGITEDRLVELSNNWFTVYGEGRINFNTTSFHILETLNQLPPIKISKLEQIMCEQLDRKLPCCKITDVKGLANLAKNSIFKAIRIIKSKKFHFRHLRELRRQINDNNTVKQTKNEVESILKAKLYNCCIINYEGTDETSYCREWARDESSYITDRLFTHITDTVTGYIDVNSNHYKIDIVVESQGIDKHVTAVVNTLNDNIRYWYSHYYKDYQSK